MKEFLLAIAIAPCAACASTIAADISAVRAGAVQVHASAQSLTVHWADRQAHHWRADFSLNSEKPLITAISADGKSIITEARPVYRLTAGKRSGGWDAFFDIPPAAPEGTRSFWQRFHPEHVTARTVGDRVEVVFDGMQLGIFHGSLRYTFYPGSALIEQAALLSTDQPDTAYFYDAGLQMKSEADVRSGGNMEATLAFYDAEGKLTRQHNPYGSERHTLQVRYRTAAAKMGEGSVAVFPAPHRYMFARDYTTNQGYLWYTAWRGQVSLGIQQHPDDNTLIDPWMNAPPGSVQQMQMFILPSTEAPEQALNSVLAYTHADHFPHITNYVTFAPHWHLAYSLQQQANGPQWQPPFKRIMQDRGIDSAMIMDFHVDGHPGARTNVRLEELRDYYKNTRAQSDNNFLLIPAEEANVYLGGHWALVFPHPVLWFQHRDGDQPLKSTDPTYGAVYRIGSPQDAWAMVQAEGGWVYQTHPRTKGSTGYPDKILDTAYIRDPHYLGTGWKAMPSDLSLERLGDRAFRTIDGLNNLGLHKHMLAEIDVFQLNPTDELYGHLNINYLRLDHLPDFDHYADILHSVEKGDGFITTGEILLPQFSLQAQGANLIHAEGKALTTFPLHVAELVWGDGKQTHREKIDLSSTHEFEDYSFSFNTPTPAWKWARLELWDIAGNGAFTQPIWNGAK